MYEEHDAKTVPLFSTNSVELELYKARMPEEAWNDDDNYEDEDVDDVGVNDVDDVDVVCCFVLNKYKFMVSKSYSLTLRFASLVGPPSLTISVKKYLFFKK